MRFEDLKDWFRLRRFVTNPLEAVRFRKGQRPGRDLLLRFRAGHRLRLRGGMVDYHLFHRIYLRDEYRLATLPAGKAECIVDLGANVGVFSSRAALCARRVVAYEPFPGNFTLLRENTTDLPAVEPVAQAVAGQEGVLRLYSPVEDGHSGSFSAHYEEGRLDADRVSEVPATTLPALFARHGIERCDLLKIDVEGAEYDILYNCDADTMNRIARIHGEYHQVEGEENTIARLVSFLESRGFQVEVQPHRHKDNHGMLYARRA